MAHDHHRSDYHSPEPPTDWQEQDWLLILEALDHYARKQYLTEGQELRVYQLLKSIANSTAPSHLARPTVSTKSTSSSTPDL